MRLTGPKLAWTGRGAAVRAWMERSWAHWQVRSEVGLWYHPAYAPSALAGAVRATELDLERGERVLGLLAEHGWVRPGDVRAPPTASFEELRRFHTDAYLESTADRAVLAGIFGLPPEGFEVEPVLEAQRLAVGGTQAAARAVVGGALEAAVNLGGGFHHAERDRGAGFCVLNDVGVAIEDLRAGGFTARIAVLDLDFHQGDGSAAAFVDDPSVLCVSVHGSVWSRSDHVEGRDALLTGEVDDARYLDTLDRVALPAVRAFAPRLLFYVAGNDVLAGDALGTFSLSPEGVLARDRRVIGAARAMGAGLVVTLGGGYSARAWRSTAALCAELLTGRAEDAARVLAAEPRRERALELRYADVARSLDPAALSRDDEPLSFTEAELFGAFGPRRESRKFLGYYSPSGVELAFERYGLLGALRERGYQVLRMVCDPRDVAAQVVRVFGRRDAADEEVLLVELVVRREPSPLPGVDEQVLYVEWLLLQDPHASFSLARPRLPGQVHPGVGLASEVLEMLVQACHRIGLGAVMARPSHYQTAAVWRRSFLFVDPELEGRLRAIVGAMQGTDLAEVARALDEGRLRTASGAPLEWTPAPSMRPVSPASRAHFESPAYRETLASAERRWAWAGLRLVSEETG
jgi:acetoin utilization deacetylase AcuC-like enzyme